MKLTLAKKMYGVVGLLMVAILGISIVAYFVSSSIIRGYDNIIETKFHQLEVSMEAMVELGKMVAWFKIFKI